MSFEKMTQVRDSPRFRGTTKWVLMAIAMREGANGREAWPSVAQIAEDVGAGKSTVSKIICSLEHMGVLKVTRRPNKTSKYAVDPSMLDPSDREVTPLKSRGLDPSDREGEYTREQTTEQTPAGRPARMVDMKASQVLEELEGGAGLILTDEEMVGKLDSMDQSLVNALGVWRDTCSRCYKMYIPELTRKEVGQMKQFMKRAPEGRQLAVMGYAVRHWDRFVSAVGRDFGWTGKLPLRPKVGFLLAGVATAVDLLDGMKDEFEGMNKGKQFYSDF